MSLFKSNNPGVVIFYFLYIVLFRICFFLFSTNADLPTEHQEPLSVLLFGFLQNISTNYELLSLLLASALCFIQALLVNGIVNENRILSKKNYLAGAVFVILASFFKESLFLTSASVALTFVILSVSRLFSLSKKEKSYGDVFDTGFWIAVATLFYFPCILFIIFAYVGLSTLRPFSYREWIIVLLGFIAPLFLVFTFYYWNDNVPLLLQHGSNFNLNGWFIGTLPSISQWLMIGAMSFLTLASMVLLPSVIYSSVIQVRKFSSALVLLIFLIAIAFLLQSTVSYSHLVLLSLPVSILLSMVLMQLKRKLVSEVIHIILILLVLAGQLIPFFSIQ